MQCLNNPWSAAKLPVYHARRLRRARTPRRRLRRQLNVKTPCTETLPAPPKFIAIMRVINHPLPPRLRSRHCALVSLYAALLLGSSEDSVFKRLGFKSATVLATMTLVATSGASLTFGGAANVVVPRSISELITTATLHLGKTADWVTIVPGAVWVGSTGPFAVHRIDPKTNKRVATVKLPGEPCAGLATGFGSLWIPLCGRTPLLAKVDLESNKLTNVFKIGPAAAEGGVTASSDSVWLVIDKDGSLARIDPDTCAIRQTIRIPPGSYNPFYSDGQIWVTRAAGSQITAVDAVTGVVSATAQTGPGPRFLTAGAGAVWTLNQGDGSLTRIDPRTKKSTKSIALRTPGNGGDVSFGGGMVWTTVRKIPLSVVDGDSATLICQWQGAGGDSLGIGDGAIWLTDYHAGTISRFELDDTLARCKHR
jgi:virginiamycin B lyase